jgi:AcrR family transcriptional regulator
MMQARADPDARTASAAGGNTYQKSHVTRQRIVDAAARVVAREGYPKASIARITQEAGMASGLFYYYFASKDELLSQVLPDLGQRMIDFIGERVRHMESGVEREVESFIAYFDFLSTHPEFYRLFSEAEVYSPVAYEAHNELVMNNYIRWLLRQQHAGWLTIAAEDCSALAYSLIGVRTALTKLVFRSDEGQSNLPSSYVDIYRRLLKGVFVN